MMIGSAGAWRVSSSSSRHFRVGDRDYIVDEIVEQWYGPDDSFYKVRGRRRQRVPASLPHVHWHVEHLVGSKSFSECRRDGPTGHSKTSRERLAGP